MAKQGFFLRFVDSPESAERDLTRGYSYAWSRGFYTSEEDAIAAGEEATLTIMEYEHAGKTGWAFAQDGLCGFGPFETAEECEEELPRQQVQMGKSAPAFVAIFEGRYAGQDIELIGDLFTPYEIVKVWKH